MKIGIVVYSYSNNTRSVAERMADAMKLKGYKVNVEQVEVIDDDPNSSKPIQFKFVPQITDYDMIIFGSPVRAFSLASPMKLYLSEIENLTSKKIYCFVTQHFKKAWLGGNRAVGQMKECCKIKGANVEKSGVINWSSDEREQQIESLIEKFLVF